MRLFVAALLLLPGLAASNAALAGGSAVPVVVVSLVDTGGTDYTLIVEPVAPSTPDPYPDPYMGHCSRFTVAGTYSRLAGFTLTRPPIPA